MKNVNTVEITHICEKSMMNTNICAVGIIHMGKWEIGIQQRMEHVERGTRETMGNMLE